MSHPVRHRTKGELLRDLEDATKTALVLAHVQIPDLDHTDTILEELKGVFEDNDIQPPLARASVPRLCDLILIQDAPQADRVQTLDNGQADQLNLTMKASRNRLTASDSDSAGSGTSAPA
jgi:hypothetical protein